MLKTRRKNLLKKVKEKYFLLKKVKEKYFLLKKVKEKIFLLKKVKEKKFLWVFSVKKSAKKVSKKCQKKCANFFSFGFLPIFDFFLLTLRKKPEKKILFLAFFLF